MSGEDLETAAETDRSPGHVLAAAREAGLPVATACGDAVLIGGVE